MNPVDFEQTNLVMGPPDGMSDEECGSMSVAHVHTPSGHEVFISCWELSEEEMKILLETKKVWLWQFGDHVQPVALGIEHPFNTPDIEKDKEDMQTRDAYQSNQLPDYFEKQ